MINESLKRRAKAYAQAHGLSVDLDNKLGDGEDGIVWKTTAGSVVKVFERNRNYEQERDSYLRLSEKKVEKISGFAVPQLVRYDDELMIVEMEYVSPPCLIDFGKAKLDFPPDFSQEAMNDWNENGIDMFGEEKWAIVRGVKASLQMHGIYYTDCKPGNIMFPPDD